MREDEREALQYALWLWRVRYRRSDGFEALAQREFHDRVVEGVCDRRARDNPSQTG